MSKYFTTLTITRPAYLSGGSWLLKDLNDVTVLFGKNGAGKSQLLRDLRNSDQNTYHYTSPERYGEITHDVGIMQEELTGAKRAGRRKFNASPTYRQESISRVQALLIKIGNLSGRSGKSPLILDEIESILHVLLPDFKFKVTDQNPPFELKRTHNEEPVSSVNNLSSGESEILTLALDLLTICAIWKLDNQTSRVLLIDEPDTHLHPDLQQHLGKFFIKLVDKYNVQIIVATHSTTLLSALGYHGGKKTSVIYLNSANEEQKAIKFEKSLQELSTCLGGHALMGPLFNAPLLLVEGDDDYKIWSHVPRYHKVKIAVIPCSGSAEVKKYQKTLENIFSCLRTNKTDIIGIALLDGDKNLPLTSRSNKQDSIKFIRLGCRESENLYLSDEVLAILGLDWEAAITKIKEQSNHYGKKKNQLDGCDAWDRKNEDLKNLISPISEILDTKKVPWTTRVAKVIGDNKPDGQLANFLGAELVNALWK